MIKTAYLAGGCFWGLEDLFREQPGVTDTEVGYSGGENDDPTYEFHPGHAEAIAISYDTDRTDFAHLLDFFFRVHNPTTLNRQGNDVGSAYRSAIFYQDEEELGTANDIIGKVNESGLYDGKPVVTSLEPFKRFWSAEDYHQDYLRKNPGGYTCHFVRSQQSLLET